MLSQLKFVHLHRVRRRHLIRSDIQHINYESTTAVRDDHMLRGIRIPKNCYEITLCLHSAFFGGKNNINSFPLAIDTVSHK